MKRYKAAVRGEISVIAEDEDGVRECLAAAELVCPASYIRFLDIEKITFVKEVDKLPDPEEHPHPHE